MEKNTIGNRIEILIEKLGLNKGEFAKKADISQSLISNIISGNNGPSRATVNLICNTYHVNKTWLRTGEGEMFDNEYKSEALNQTFYIQGDEMLTQEEAIFMGSYRQLTSQNRIVIRATVDSMIKTQKQGEEDFGEQEKLSV